MFLFLVFYSFSDPGDTRKTQCLKIIYFSLAYVVLGDVFKIRHDGLTIIINFGCSDGHNIKYENSASVSDDVEVLHVKDQSFNFLNMANNVFSQRLLWNNIHSYLFNQHILHSFCVSLSNLEKEKGIIHL